MEETSGVRKRITSTFHDKKKYTSIPSGYRDTADAAFSADQFEEPPKEFPFKSAFFILFFMLGGIVCLLMGLLISVGTVGEKYSDRGWPLVILGTIMFIPGGYYGFIIISVLLRRRGFTIDDIPKF